MGAFNFIKGLIQPASKKSRWIVALCILAFVIAINMGLFDAAVALLKSERFSFSIGTLKFTMYSAIESTLFLLLLFWITSIISHISSERIKRMPKITTGNKAIITKIAQIIIYFIAFLVSLDFLGIDLKALTVFSGAIGIGIGLGLQKISSNFMSGLVMLFEKAVKEGDLVEIGDNISGHVRETNTRYTLIETFDGREVMIPNEDFVTTRVINWTFSHNRGRVSINVGVSYQSDIELAHKLMLEAARENPMCSKNPEPECFLREFGDNSVNFLLNFWVDDVMKGRYGPQSEIMFSIWRKFHEHGIEIPYPQHDVHIKGPIPFQVAEGSVK